jgi:hypothetical protein
LNSSLALSFQLSAFSLFIPSADEISRLPSDFNRISIVSNFLSGLNRLRKEAFVVGRDQQGLKPDAYFAAFRPD